MVEDKVVQQLSKDLHSGDVQLQTTAAYHVRDLSTADEDYCRALGTAGVVPALVGLLDTPQKEVTLVAAQALASLSGNPDLRTLIRESGGIPNLVTLLKEAASIREEVVQASLRCLLGIAQDDAGRQAMHAAGVVPPIIKLLGPKTDAGLRQQSVRLLGRMAYNDASKDAVRDAHGIQGLLRILETASGDRGLAETVAQALTILAFNNEMNQDHIREQYGVPLLLKQLESTPFDSLTAAVADAVRSISMNNDANKNAVRENWGIPLLAKMLGPDVALNVQEKAVDCLRILTTGNDANRLALYSNHAAVCAIVRLTQNRSEVMVTERAAAVLGNLSSSEEYFQGLREAGAVPPLVALLEGPPTSRITEIAAFTLANLAVNSANRLAIRVAGGVPPLVRLLTERPSDQALVAIEECLRRLNVSDVERNAMLEAFRYSDGLAARRAAQASAGTSSRDAEVGDLETKPLMRYRVEEVCALLEQLGFQDTSSFREAGVTGADLAHLTEEEMRTDLLLSNLKIKKVLMIQKAFELFCLIQTTPGRDSLTVIELKEWLNHLGRSEAEMKSLINILQEQSGSKTPLALIYFATFARSFQSLIKTLTIMQLSAEQGGPAPVPQVPPSPSLSANSDATAAGSYPASPNLPILQA